VKNKYLFNAIKAVANGDNIDLAETKALGCAIKFAKK
jgi:hypothetical protein